MERKLTGLVALSLLGMCVYGGVMYGDSLKDVLIVSVTMAALIPVYFARVFFDRWIDD